MIDNIVVFSLIDLDFYVVVVSTLNQAFLLSHHSYSRAGTIVKTVCENENLNLN